MTFATWSSAFDGMHPRYTHTPPGLASGSTSAVLSPRSAARNAAAYPPGPPPITTTCTSIMECRHEDTKTRRRHEHGFVQNVLRASFVFFVSSWPRRLTLQREEKRLFEDFGDPADEAGAVGAVDRAVVVRE